LLEEVFLEAEERCATGGRSAELACVLVGRLHCHHVRDIEYIIQILISEVVLATLRRALLHGAREGLRARAHFPLDFWLL